MIGKWRETRLNQTIKVLTEERDKIAEECAGLETESATLRATNRELREQLEALKHKKKLEEEEILHLVKINEEKNAIAAERKAVELEAKKTAEIAAVKDQYRDKIEKHLEARAVEIKTMYSEILERLPNVSVRLKGET